MLSTFSLCLALFSDSWEDALVAKNKTAVQELKTRPQNLSLALHEERQFEAIHNTNDTDRI